MRRFGNILVVASGRGGAERCVGTAGALAVRNGASLRILEVVRPLPSYARMLRTDFDVDEIEASATRARKEALERVADRLREGGLRVETDVLRGKPFVEIIREVQRRGHDLVIKSAGEEGNLPSVLFGSLDLHLLRKCPCPVWLLKPDADPSFQRILAAVDVGAETEEGRSLNRTLLELSTSLARHHRAELHVVHCWKIPGASLLERRIPPTAFASYRAEIFAEVSGRFIDLLADFAEEVPPECQHLLEGEPDTSLAQIAHDHRIDLVVMGTVARSGIPGFLIGNTAEKLLGQIRCAVLAAKPDGFVSPVEVPGAVAGAVGGTTERA